MVTLPWWAWGIPLVQLAVTVFHVMYASAVLRATLRGWLERLEKLELAHKELEHEHEEHGTRLTKIETTFQFRHRRP